MKYCKIICLVLVLMLMSSLSVFGAESSEDAEESVSGGGGYGYAISYGYKPLRAPNGVNAANYITGPTPPTEYVPAGGSHTAFPGRRHPTGQG